MAVESKLAVLTGLNAAGGAAVAALEPTEPGQLGRRPAIADEPDEPTLRPRTPKPPVPSAALEHTRLREGPFWQAVPAYAEVGEAEFLDHRWQAKHTITKIPKLLEALAGLVSDAFIEAALRRQAEERRPRG